jgi:anti-anti-sigma regulatory factor
MLTSSIEARRGAAVMRLTGTLDDRTYRQVRDSVIKVAVDTSAAVVIDVNGLQVCGEQAWAAFTSARSHVQQWPGVPIALVLADPMDRLRLQVLSFANHVPVYPDVGVATAMLGETVRRRHRGADERFGPHASSVNGALVFVREHLLAWSMHDRIAVASTVATVFAENALTHAGNDFEVRVEDVEDNVIVAVSDGSPALAVRRERPPGSCPTGLDIVAALCRHWGNAPTATGKTVWARIGPDDTFAGIANLLR